MNNQLLVQIDAWPAGSPIPAKFAFGKPGDDGPFATSDNRNPAIRWSHAPEATRSFALLCHDPDAPASGEDANRDGHIIQPDAPRARFYHWVLVDIPASVQGIEEGAASKGVTPRGKAAGPTPVGVSGKNDYTGWFAGDPAMEGVYGGYDGPCPPWNDALVHRYHFDVFALDIETLGLGGPFGGDEACAAMAGHILAQGRYSGTYSMNPNIKGRL